MTTSTSPPPGRVERAARVLWVLFSLYLLYGTVIPFDILVHKNLVAQKVKAIEWVPFVDKEEGGLAPRPDMLANVVLFVPFGFLGFWTMRHRSGHALTVLAAVSGLGLAQSLCIEVLQLFTRMRTTATTDLIVNTVGVVTGVAVGLLSAPLVERLRRAETLRRWLRSTAAFPALAATVGVAAETWQPFLFSLDARDLLPKLRKLAADPFVLPATLSREPLHFLMFFLFGLAVATLLRENRVRHATVYAALLGVAAACALEPTRLAVHHQLPGVSALAAKLAGAVLGAPAAAVVTQRRRPLLWCVLMFVATVGVLAGAGLSPYRFVAAAQGFGWVPFLPYYVQATVDAVTDAVDTVLQVMPFGFVVGLLYPGKRRALAAGAACVAACAAAIEMGQRYLPARLPDVTDVLVAGAGVAMGFCAASLGAARFRKLVAEHPAE